MLIIGWGGGVTQDLGEVAPTTCPHCHNPVFLHQITSNKQISLYFVPIVPYASNVYLACPICHSGVQLQPAQVPAADHMRGTTRQFRHQAVDETAYRAAVTRFWASLGIAPSGDQVLHPAPTIPAPQPPPSALPAAQPAQLAESAGLHREAPRRRPPDRRRVRGREAADPRGLTRPPAGSRQIGSAAILV